MTPYRSPERRSPFVLRVSPIPLSALLSFASMMVVLVGLVHLLTREVTVACTRAGDVAAWSCDVTEWRAAIVPMARRTVDLPLPSGPGSAIDPAAVTLKVASDGGGVMMAGNQELSRFPLREVGAAHSAARTLAHQLGEAGNRSANASVTVPPGKDLLYWCGLPVVVLAALWAFFRPSTFVVDPNERSLEVELRSSPFSRTRFSASLSKVVGVTPGPDLDLAISLSDGTVHHLAPMGWSERTVAQRARVLREAIEQAVG